MKKIVILLVVVLLGVFLLGCSQQPNYSNYNQQPQGQQCQYVGGGCGVAPAGDYENTPIANNIAAFA